MSVDVPIVDSGGRLVALFVWDGRLYQGKGEFHQVAATSEQIKSLRGIIAINHYLRQVRFKSVGDRETVSGWQGIEGTVGALRLALPAIGLHVGQFDTTNIIDAYPFELGRGLETDLLV